MDNPAELNRTPFIAAAEDIAANEAAVARALNATLVAKAEPLIEKLTKLKNYYGTFGFRREKYKRNDYLTIRFTKGLRTGDMFLPGIDFRYYALFVHANGAIHFGLAETFKGLKDEMQKSFETTDQAVEHIVKELAHRNLLKAPVRTNGGLFKTFGFLKKILS